VSQPIPVSASDWNHLFDLAAGIALVAMSIVIGAMIYFIIKYRERKDQPKFVPDFRLGKSRARDSVIFASISIIILGSLVAASYSLTPNARFEPTVSHSLAIDVTAYQWGWRFGYPNGLNTFDNVTLPGNTTIMFNVTSTDVMHNFYLVQFRVSIEAVPGKYNVIWVTTPTATGDDRYIYNLYCKELCGVGHTFMDATVTVISPSVYNQWMANQTDTTPSTAGG
jgi:cytochrome c oxidase subunit II